MEYVRKDAISDIFDHFILVFLSNAKDKMTQIVLIVSSQTRHNLKIGGSKTIYFRCKFHKIYMICNSDLPLV